MDGTGAGPRTGDVLVEGDTITRVTEGGARPSADRLVDISGLTIAPGFIDMHTHSDLQVLCSPDHTSKLLAGCDERGASARTACPTHRWMMRRCGN